MKSVVEEYCRTDPTSPTGTDEQPDRGLIDKMKLTAFWTKQYYKRSNKGVYQENFYRKAEANKRMLENIIINEIVDNLLNELPCIIRDLVEYIDRAPLKIGEKIPMSAIDGIRKTI